MFENPNVKDIQRILVVEIRITCPWMSGTEHLNSDVIENPWKQRDNLQWASIQDREVVFSRLSSGREGSCLFDFYLEGLPGTYSDATIKTEMSSCLPISFISE